MSKAKFGATSWDEVDLNVSKDKKATRDQYLRLDSGSNIVRVITKPHEYLVHRVKLDPKEAGFGDRIMSSMFHGSDPLCEEPYNLKPKRRWLIGVIDRKTQSYKILDMSPAVFKGIQELVRDEDWGDPTQYDIDIKVNKQGGATGYYAVIPKSKKPLSPADLEIKQNVDLEDLKRKCTPPTREQVEARLQALKEKKGLTAAQNAAENYAESNAADEADDDFDFPAVQGSV